MMCFSQFHKIADPWIQGFDSCRNSNYPLDDAAYSASPFSTRANLGRLISAMDIVSQVIFGSYDIFHKTYKNIKAVVIEIKEGNETRPLENQKRIKIEVKLILAVLTPLVVLLSRITMIFCDLFGIVLPEHGRIVRRFALHWKEVSRILSDCLSLIIKEKESCEILGLSRNATQEEIKRTYWKESVKYHPDKNPNGREMFEKINEAYRCLTTDTSLRGIYRSLIAEFEDKGWL